MFFNTQRGENNSTANLPSGQGRVMSSSGSNLKGKTPPAKKTNKRKRADAGDRKEEKEGKEEQRAPRVIVIEGNPGPVLPPDCPFVQRNDWYGLVRAYRYTVPPQLSNSFASIGAFRSDLAAWARWLRLLQAHEVHAAPDPALTPVSTPDTGPGLL